MKILFVSQAAWDDKNSVGNTLSNWFEGDLWKNYEFFHFYTRKQNPHNRINATYYNLSAIDIIKGILKFKIRGKVFSNLNKNFEIIETSQLNKEINQIDKLHSSTNKKDFIYFLHEQVWNSKIWFNKSFKKFLDKPDILFCFATNQYILLPIVKYLKKHTNCKIVLFIADDVYGAIDNVAWYRQCYLRKEFEKCIEYSDKLYAVSEEMCELYEQRFNKPVEVLYKGCDLSTEPKGFLNEPIKIVYAGNLYYGRDDTLAELAKALEKINSTKTVAKLEIYTGATITSEIERKLNIVGSSEIMGSRPYNEIKEIMKNADIVLHVESFEEKQKELVKYSFSTKIIDCLQSGNVVLGIGPSNIASIEYLKKIDGAFVIDDMDNIFDSISKILNEKNILNENAKKTRDFAKENHELTVVREKLKEDLTTMCKGKSNESVAN